MPDIKPLKRLEVAATETGELLVLAMQTIDGEIFSFLCHSEKIGALTSSLLRIATNPIVGQHSPQAPPRSAGTFEEIAPLPLEAISVAVVPILSKVAVILDLPGGIQMTFHLSQGDGSKLSQDLQAAVARAKVTEGGQRH
jgi:hypothetical protein